MSKPLVTVEAPKAPVYMAAAQKKVFSVQNFPSMVAGMVAFHDDEMATPSMVKMNKAAAAAALGGKATPVSFASGLLFVVAAFANGQYGKNVETIAKGLPPVSGFAVRHALNLVACGKGVTCKNLKNAALSAISATLALDSKPKAAPKAEKPAIEGESVRIETEQAAAPHWSDVTGKVSKAADFDVMAAALNERHEKAAAAEQAQAAADKAAATLERAKEGPALVDLFGGLVHNNAEQAAALLADMAAALGLILITPAQAAILAAAEQAAQAATKAPRKAKALKAA